MLLQSTPLSYARAPICRSSTIHWFNKLYLPFSPSHNLLPASAGILTYNVHHSGGPTTDALTLIIGWAGVGPSITSNQIGLGSGVPTVAVIVTTRYEAAATCWPPAVSYSTSRTHTSARQSDSWCCPVVWWLIARLRRRVADGNHNSEGWWGNILCNVSNYKYTTCNNWELSLLVSYTLYHSQETT